MNQILSFRYGKRIKRNFQVIPHDQKHNPNLFQNKEFNPSSPYSIKDYMNGTKSEMSLENNSHI